jgi:transcription initiation factor TFIID subunit 5
VIIPSITSSVPNNNTATSSYLQHYKSWLISLVRPREILEKRNKRRRQIMIRERERGEKGGGVGFAKEDEEESDQGDYFTSLHVNIEDKNGGEGNEEENNRPMGDALEPSVIFATIGNTNEGLNCLAMNESINQVVTGHHDSIVRVWRLDQTEDNPDLVFGQALREYLGKNSWELDDVRPKLPHVYDRQQQQGNNGNGNGLDLTVAHNNGSSSSSSGGNNRGIVSSSSSSSNRYPMLEFVGHDLPIFAVDQSKSGRVIASSSADETIRLWDTSVIQCVSKIRCTSVAWDIKFHPFDYYFATAHANRSVSLYTTDQVTPLRLMTGHSSDVNCVAWHPNALYLASGSDDRSVRFWDIRNAECVKLFRGCGSAISSVAISPIGNLIAASAESGNIYLWDIRSSKQLAILNGHDGPAYSVAFNANGTVLSSGGKDCSVRIWDLAPAIFPGYNESTTSSFEKGPYRLIRPKHSFFTKASPVYHVGITSQNLVYAGGPCSLDAATCKSIYIYMLFLHRLN